MILFVICYVYIGFMFSAAYAGYVKPSFSAVCRVICLGLLWPLVVPFVALYTTIFKDD